MMLPYSIITISIITALLPHLSKLAIEKRPTEVRDQLIRAIKMVGVVTVPSSVAFLLFGPIITKVLFVGIDYKDSTYIGYVLSALGIGLVTFSINLILIRGFNAFEDTRTQILSILLINLISVALSYLFLNILKSEWITIGLGFAFSVSYIIGLFLTLALLTRHTGKISIHDFFGQHFKLYLASFLAMAPIFLLSQYFGWVDSDSTPIIRLAELALVLIATPIAYFFIARRMKVDEISITMELVKVQVARATSSRRKSRNKGGE